MAERCFEEEGGDATSVLCARTRESTSIIPIVAGAPLRFTEEEDRLDQVDSHLQALEQKLLDASARRIHDFERRLEHEWLALRQLHEEPLKTLQHRTTAITENCLIIVREALALLRSQVRQRANGRVLDEAEQPAARVVDRRSLAMPIGLLAAVATLAIFSAYTQWSLGNELRAIAARAASAERRATELQQTVERQTRNTEETVQRLTSDALTSAVRAQRLANVLAASDVRVFLLRGQRTAAATTGQIFFSRSRGVAVNVTRLPPTSANQVYQVWLATTGGPISLGFVAPDAQGRIDAAFDTPPELVGNVTGFMLSLEPTGGNAKPTGPIVVAS